MGSSVRPARDNLEGGDDDRVQALQPTLGGDGACAIAEGGDGDEECAKEKSAGACGCRNSGRVTVDHAEHAEEAQDDSDTSEAGCARAAGGEADEQSPDGRGGVEDGGDAGGDGALSPGEEAERERIVKERSDEKWDEGCGEAAFCGGPRRAR